MILIVVICPVWLSGVRNVCVVKVPLRKGFVESKEYTKNYLSIFGPQLWGSRDGWTPRGMYGRPTGPPTRGDTSTTGAPTTGDVVRGHTDITTFDVVSGSGGPSCVGGRSTLLGSHVQTCAERYLEYHRGSKDAGLLTRSPYKDCRRSSRWKGNIRLFAWFINQNRNILCYRCTRGQPVNDSE